MTSTWTAVGPTAVQTNTYGMVSGRVTALALDPSDTTGNHLYVGTTGGGVWVAQNAATNSAANVAFTPLTDAVGALGGSAGSSISVGALTVQPGGTGVILAGTGDPNDVLDSYYGSGILRSADGGVSWSLITATDDVETGLGTQNFSFLGNGFAGFAWSTTNLQLVVAAVSQAYEGTLVNAGQPGSSYEGLYYSQDSGATWHLATITDGGGSIVQGPTAALAQPGGNAATSVVWNPVRQLFIAAVRFHGYYQSPDGVTWTRMSDQPSSALTTSLCPTKIGGIGSIACPIYRGTLAVNPTTGDTFAWTVDINNQDQGLWQDQCSLAGSQCGNPTVTFGRQWPTTAFETNTNAGAVTIPDGSYTLALSAVPSGQDTILLAGGDDLWKCSLASGCVWRDTTCAAVNQSAKVAPYHHALTWSAANPEEIFDGNDSGLWRSLDAIGETGAVCAGADVNHFQNLNAGLGSLAEVESMAADLGSSYGLLTGLGVNGAAGVKSSTASADWPQVLSGFGGPVAIDPANTYNWYVNDQMGVGIYRCSQAAPCTPSNFGSNPVVTEADVSNDGLTMTSPAPFLVDPLDSSQLLVATCRLWRGPANNSGGWSSSNAISAILSSGATTGSCSGDALIRSVAAASLGNGAEKIYVGMYGSLTGGATRAGHVLSATYNLSSDASPTWTDLTFNPVANDANTLNKFGFDISSIAIDPHDATGNTVYVTVEGTENAAEAVQIVYRSTDGGAHWTDITSNLPETPANAVVIDQGSANTVYVATDEGVFYTTDVAECAASRSVCWSEFGTGLPPAPVINLAQSTSGATSPVLMAGTYGRGVWQTALWSSNTSFAVASVNPSSLSFGDQPVQSLSAAQTVTVTNTGANTLAISSISVPNNFVETDDCSGNSIAAGATCSIRVQFAPTTTGPLAGQMVIAANIYGGQVSVELLGTGTTASLVTIDPLILNFGSVPTGTTSAALSVTVNNASTSPLVINSLSVTPPFSLGSNVCGTANLAASTSCQIQVTFSPTQKGSATGTLALVDAAGTQIVTLNGTGASPATDTLSPTSLGFPATATGSESAAQTVTITNSGGVPLTGISVSVSGPFQTTSTCGTQLAAQSTCSVSVIFAPTQTGNITGTLSIADMLQTQTVALSGTAVAPPSFSLNPTSMTFTNQQAGVASAPQTLTVTNAGAVSMANVGFQFSGTGAANYSVLSTTCGATLGSGQSCAAQIVFTPGSTGSIMAVLTVSSSTFGVTPATVSLNGGGVITSGVTVIPALLTFSTVGVGQTSSAQSVTILNTTGYDAGVLRLSISGPFTLAQNNCAADLAAGASCSATVAFAPTASGAASGALAISSTALAAPTTVQLAGTGFDFAVAASGSAGISVASGQTASFTVNIVPANNAAGSFTYACGTLPSHALCLFNPTTTAIGAGATGSFTVQISTGSSLARMEKPAVGGAVPMLPLACGLLVLPLALRRRCGLWLVLALVLFTGYLTACASAGINSNSSGGGSSGGSGSGSSTPAGTYTVPVTVSSLGVSHSVNLTLTVD